MTYHNLRAGAKQATLLATSKDGVNFKRINGNKNSVILKGEPRQGHTGYFRWGSNRFSELDYKYIGYSLYGEGHDAMWGSNDIIRWKRLESLDLSVGNCSVKDRRMVWHDIDPNSITPLGNEEYVAISTIREPAHGGHGSNSGIYEIFLSSKGNCLTRVSRKILPDGRPGTGDERLANSIVVGDTWYIIYLAKKRKRKRRSQRAPYSIREA
jgi:hypothetical protein